MPGNSRVERLANAKLLKRGLKRCSMCKSVKPVSEYYIHRGRFDQPCKACSRVHRREYLRLWHLEHRKERNKRARERAHESDDYKVSNDLWSKKLKREVFSHYSPKLKCVGYDNTKGCPFKCKDLRCLSIDHINGGGTNQREQLRVGGGFYSWLRKHHYPKGYQVLCMNCQFIKRLENHELGNGSLKYDQSIHKPMSKSVQITAGGMSDVGDYPVKKKKEEEK